MTYRSWSFMWFKAISELKINFDKSELILVRMVDNIDDLALELGCKVSNLHFSLICGSLG